MAVKLGELLLKAKLITPDNLAAAQGAEADRSQARGEPGEVGFVTEEDITETCSRGVRFLSINLTHFEIDSKVLKWSSC